MDKKEIWKDVSGYEGIYQVSNCGRVKRVGNYRNQCAEWKSNRILKPAVKNNGYLFCQLCKNNETSHKMIHRLVAEAFIENPDNKPTVNHIDGDRKNNTVQNLEWATYSENNKHSLYELQKFKKGDRYNTRGKPVIQYDKQGKELKEYASYREAERVTGIHGIDVVCRGKRQKGRRQYTAGGYIWRYKEDVIQD